MPLILTAPNRRYRCTETADHPHDRVCHVQTYQVITINASAPGLEGFGAIYLSILSWKYQTIILLLYVKY